MQFKNNVLNERQFLNVDIQQGTWHKKGRKAENCKIMSNTWLKEKWLTKEMLNLQHKKVVNWFISEKIG